MLDAKKMKVAELRNALSARGMDAKGLKSELVVRLQERLDEKEYMITKTAGVVLRHDLDHK